MSARLCLFCPNPIGPKTSPEHILLDALGGRATTRRVLCTSCNNIFGSTIDKELTQQIEPLRTILNLQSGSKKPPPSYRYRSDSGNKYNLAPDGSVTADSKPIKFSPGSSGQFRVDLNVNNLEDINTFIPHIAAKIGLPEDEIRRQMETADARWISQAAPPLSAKLSFGGHDPLRSMVKSCLVLCAAKSVLEIIRGSHFEAARNFVKTGDEVFQKSRIVLEGRDIPNIEKIEKEYGPIFNIIFCKSDTNGRMIGYYGLYNVAYWQIMLSDGGALPGQAFGVVSDPRNVKKWRHFDSSIFDLDSFWMANPVLGIGDRVEQSLSVAIAQRQQVQKDDHLGKIIRETMLSCGIKYGDRMTSEFMARLSQRVAFWWSQATFEEKLTPEQLRAAMRGE